jgi:hypothetical protein
MPITGAEGGGLGIAVSARTGWILKNGRGGGYTVDLYQSSD